MPSHTRMGMQSKQTLTQSLHTLYKRKKLLLAVIVTGFLIRLIAAINVGDSADAMHFVTHAINFYSSGRLEAYDQTSGLWFVITSLFYKWFGTSTFSSHLAALFFGTATIPVMYMLAKEFFDEKVSLVAAFVVAIAPFHIMNTSAEMDVMAMFFTLSAMFFFIRAIKHKHSWLYGASGIFFGLAIYTKVYPVLFVPSLFIFAAYSNYKHRTLPWRVLLKKIIIFCACVFIFAIPALTHNYLLYQDKGFVDLQFTRTFGIGENTSVKYYGFDPIFGEKNDWHGFFLGNSKHGGDDHSPLFIIALSFIFKPSPLIFVLGITGLALLLWKRNYNYPIFFILSIIFVLPFLASIILLPKHFLFLELLLIPTAAFTLSGIISKLSLLTKKDMRVIVFIMLLVLTLLLLGKTPSGTFAHFYGQSYVTQMIQFKEDLPQNTLIVADGRIYRGQTNWMLYGKPYLEASEFIEFTNQLDQLPGEAIFVDVYYIECVYDDCGWGTIASQPEFNKTMEKLAEFFAENGRLVMRINEPSRTTYYYPFMGQANEAIRIYSTRLLLKTSMISYAQQPRNWFLYYIGYPDPSKDFDYYYPSTTPQKLLDALAHWIVLFAIILALASPFYITYLFVKTTKPDEIVS